MSRGLGDVYKRQDYRGIASELAACDSRYTAIVRSILGRTVIVEDMDAAIAMAKRYSLP